MSREASPQAPSASSVSSAPGESLAIDTPELDAGPERPVAPNLDEELLHRLRHLLDAIAANNAALCHDVQLPRKAFVEDYEHKNAAKLFDQSIDVAFRKAIARQHRRTTPRELKLLTLDVPRPMELSRVGGVGWRAPTWQVRGAKLRLRIVGDRRPGAAQDLTLEVASLVHWRGAWYIERL